MAITKIHPIKSTVQKAVNYICNPDKTDGALLIDSFACDYRIRYRINLLKAACQQHRPEKAKESGGNITCCKIIPVFHHHV